MKDDTRIQVKVRTMLPGTPEQFDRVYFYCPMGHDLGSVPMRMLHGHRMDPMCDHYEHRYA